EPIDARRAAEIGLVNAVVPPAELMPRAFAMADAIAANAPLAVRETRRGVRELLSLPLDEAYRRQEAIGRPLRASEDAAEGARASPPRASGAPAGGARASGERRRPVGKGRWRPGGPRRRRRARRRARSARAALPLLRPPARRLRHGAPLLEPDRAGEVVRAP